MRARAGAAGGVPRGPDPPLDAEALAGAPTTKGVRAPARIAAIAETLPPCRAVCEVGYDRGLILWTLLESRPELSAIGVEVQPEAAQTTPIPPPLAHRVTLRTGDGLAPLAPGEVDAVILAGLGGRTIASILEARPELVASLDSVLTSPSHLENEIRPALARLDLVIVDERLVFDRGRYYELVVARPRSRLSESGASSARPPDDSDRVSAAWGPLLIGRPDPLMAAYLDDQARRFGEAFAHGLRSYSQGPKAALGEKLALLEAARTQVARAAARGR